MNTPGQSVPWNAGWTAEERFDVRPCRYAGGELAVWQPHALGQGRPIFAKPHLVRQRRSVAEMRCTVCGERTAAADRWWFGLGDFDGDYWMTSEAPVHRACADFALTVCPHLQSLGREPAPMPGGYTIIAKLVGGEDLERKLGITIGARSVIGTLKFAWPRSMVRVD